MSEMTVSSTGGNALPSSGTAVHFSPAAEAPGRDVGPPAMDTFLKGLWKENPVFVQVLGMCPVLAVTNSVINSLTMGLATTFVLVMSGIIVSLLRRWIPKQVRIATYILIIATFVTIADYVIQAVSLEVHKSLGAFISLIVVNCIILGRAEAFASRNTLFKSILDALGMGLGFTFAVLCLGVVREVLGNGSFAGFDLFGPAFEPWIIMILPGGAFFVMGGWLLLFNWLRSRKKTVVAGGAVS
ncbi:MAG: electron transport complex subunit E [Leptospiraceae bacterium]|nr:electron transport complex subunit E [Leptospiraceae bacterium]MCB1317044.1 electron transport complex subunit E [Leptospiraceae bacterium]